MSMQKKIESFVYFRL